MRLPLFLAALTLLAVTPAALADTETFNFTLVDTTPPGVGSYAGYGSFTLDITPGQTVYTPTTGLGPITATLDGIPLSDADNRADSESVTIIDGIITDFVAYPEPTSAAAAITADGLEFGALYTYDTTFYLLGAIPTPIPGDPGHYDHYWGEDGPITFSLATTPEPSSLILLGTALLSATGLIRRRLS